MLHSFAEQILVVASFQNLLVLAGSVLVGMVFGALPGLTATLAVALLSTVTFNLSTELAMFALIGAYVGAIYGPAHSAILLGIPGTAAGAATALDGHILAQRGQGGEAIATATIASVVGTVFGLLAMILVSPLLIDMALLFTSVEFFLLAIFGVLICGSLTAPDMPAKGWISGILGLMLASVGIETIQGYQRFTMGIPELAGGIEVVPVILGAFAIPQIIRVLRDREVVGGARPHIGSLRPRLGFLWRNKGSVLRSGCIGVGVGTIPGVGEDIASWASYDTGKKLDSDPESFGKGNIKGVICAETANNACIGGAIIPVLTLGVPGSPPAAMLLGALNLHGVRPGPMLAFEAPNFIPQMGAMLLWASGFILVLGLLMARASVQVLRLPVEVLMPLVAFLAVLGSYALGLNVFNVYLMFLFGVVVYLLEELGYPVAPAVIGVLLGTMADFSIRRALLGSGGSLEPFVTRPVALILLALIVLSLALQSRLLKGAVRWCFGKWGAARNGTA
ncbi:tripartite tricarboxylate transporter permease [Marinovum sp. 2_MG-2023]|uniref:tripartite tricarboxylate transporter permease n=1 Tax=unclassified Marinovum TaxID=2647166 RepID=UPI0026E15CAD|nr:MULTISPECIES: tripartite tricarboxylate transporter permease [unclassified Marinovum]MDO6731134.1 tripartite tricarboxylate transporter permease [Marinovum sp. 2_MG-2023]MDO6778631.1 tripartite tricarboxylate transporter permease [Marinovum sp. 1_MG-2023]